MTETAGAFSLDGKLALITGASRGIGAAIADMLGAAGAKIIGTATTEEGAQAITERFQDGAIEGLGVCMNIGNPEAVVAQIKALAGEHGAIDILVNNAGITRDNLLLRMKDDEWNEVLQTNLSSVFHLSKACLRGMMKSQDGRIINIASVSGVMGNAGQTNYAAAKAGLIGFSKSLAREVGSRGITVNVVAPGFIQTAMTDGLGDERKEAIIEQVPLNRLGRVEDIAGAVLFLASPSGAYITGETIHVNGGMYMI
jgi:3-oxoacyl-[acyl-carrier protein] reductase